MHLWGGRSGALPQLRTPAQRDDGQIPQQDGSVAGMRDWEETTSKQSDGWRIRRLEFYLFIGLQLNEPQSLLSLIWLTGTQHQPWTDQVTWCFCLTCFFYFSFIYRFGLFGHVTWFKVHLNIQILKFHHVSCGLCCTWVWSHWCHRVYHVWPRVELHWTKTESVNVCLLNSMTELQLHLQKDNEVMWPV